MKKLTQKLVLSVLTMALVVVALGTSTFAWFTLTNNASISTFTANVTAGEGIEVTLGTRTDTAGVITYPVNSSSVWYTVLPIAVINQYITDTRPNFSFTDVTSQDGVVMKKINWIDSTLGTTSDGFISLPLTFRSRSQQDITWSAVTLGGTSKLWIANVGSFLHNGTTTVGTNVGVTSATVRVAASSAARVSIQGIVSTKTSLGALTPKASHVPVVYQSPADAGSEVAGQEKAFNSTVDLAAYDFTLDSVSGSATENKYIIGASAFGAGSYTLAAGKVLALATDPNAVGNPFKPAVAVTSVSASTSRVLTLQTVAGSYFQDQLVVRVYIEGWDADTFDALFTTALTVQLGFAATPTEIV